MNDQLVEQIDRLYQNRKSAKEIAAQLGFKENKVRYWMAKGGVRPRSRSEATYCKRNPNGDPFQISKQIQSHRDLMLFFVAIGLYLGEGTKKGKHHVSLGNTDPGILKAFLRFLRVICKVDEDKITAALNIFDDVDLHAAKQYWVKNVGIRVDQFRNITVRKSKGGTYKNKSKYGTLSLSILVCNSKLKRIILDWCSKTLEGCVAPL